MTKQDELDKLHNQFENLDFPTGLKLEQTPVLKKQYGGNTKFKAYPSIVYPTISVCPIGFLSEK